MKNKFDDSIIKDRGRAAKKTAVMNGVTEKYRGK
jgi:hypothetical protein